MVRLDSSLPSSLHDNTSLGHVPSASIHRMGGVLASCSGQRTFSSDLPDERAQDFAMHRISIWDLALQP